MRNSKQVISAIIVAVLFLTAIVSMNNRAVAQSDRDSMSDLVIELWDRVLENQTSTESSRFNFTISFGEPIPGLGNSINLGTALQTRRLDRVGSDYVCFAQTFSRNLNIDCVPHANISKISYQDNAS